MQDSGQQDPWRQEQRQQDYWRSSGYRLLERRADGRLIVSDAFIRAYLARPELRPPPDAPAAEQAFFNTLLEQPRRPITPVALLALDDADACQNWQIFARFRDHLLAHPTLEDAYLALFTSNGVALPALFVDQLVHVIMRNALGDGADPWRARAAECLFRSQRVRIIDEAVIVADEERLAQTPAQEAEIELLSELNALSYGERSERFDLALDLSFTSPGLDALCRVLERWLDHMIGVRAVIQPLEQVRDERWSWHAGLDAQATRLLDALWRGQSLADEERRRLLSLFRLDFRDPSLVHEPLRGRPVYLAMAMDERECLRLKPQNLLVNLPLAGS